MPHYFASEAVIPMRSLPSESSEMVSQLVFGDIAIDLEAEKNWIRVRDTFDQYEGWVSANMVTEVSEKHIDMIKGWKYVTKSGCSLELPDKTMIRIPMGARIPITVGTEKSGQIRMGPEFFWKMNPEMPGWVDQQPFSVVRSLARKFINTPYLWGGRSGYGIDCSGFTQMVYRMCGITLPRDARLQQEVGEKISFEDRKPGDLAFFSKPNQTKVTHVGIVEYGYEIIHASGKVRYDMLVKNGIFRVEDESVMTHQLVSINRYDDLVAP